MTQSEICYFASWIRCGLTCLLLLTLSAPLVGAPGDVWFTVASHTMSRPSSASSSFPAGLDVMFNVEGFASVPAIGWSMVLNIAPLPGATGTVVFNPPSGNVGPNLEPADMLPFVGFDLDSNGKSYGALGIDATELLASQSYISPISVAPPLLDPNGNLTLPNGSGLLRVPLLCSANASGNFEVSIDASPSVTAVAHAIGPGVMDVALYNTKPSVSGTLTVSGTGWTTGDYNRDGSVTMDDYSEWRHAYGTFDSTLADGNGNGVVDAADYVIWRNQFTPMSVISGDYNGDGMVSTQDYDVWRSSFGLVGSNLADGNGNGSVDAADYVVWRNNLPSLGVAALDLGSQAPEPSAFTLLGILYCLSRAVYRRR